MHAKSCECGEILMANNRTAVRLLSAIPLAKLGIKKRKSMTIRYTICFCWFLSHLNGKNTKTQLILYELLPDYRVLFGFLFFDLNDLSVYSYIKTKLPYNFTTTPSIKTGGYQRRAYNSFFHFQFLSYRHLKSRFISYTRFFFQT